MTSRLYAVDKDDFQGACLTGHSNSVVGSWFSNDGRSVFTVSKDGALFEWQLQGGEWSPMEQTIQMPRKKSKAESEKKPVLRWKAKNKFYFNQNHAKVACATFFPQTGLLSVGFDSGIFGIWELPDFTNIHTLRLFSLM
jgi:periodic tryptophan protein 2